MNPYLGQSSGRARRVIWVNLEDLKMVDERLVKRIEQARRELRIAEGTAGEEELRASALDL